MKRKSIHIVLAAILFTLCAVIVSFNKVIHASADEYPKEYIGFNKTPEDFHNDTVFKDEYDTFLEAYYTNLTDNIGKNYKGSCGYVAIGMLLSYYDTYLSDSIIPEEYDCRSEDSLTNMNKRHKSPGIYQDVIDNGSKLSNDEYYESIKEEAVSSYHPSLHAKLLTIGHEKGYYGYLSPEQPGGTTPKMVTEVLKAYLNERGFVENTDYTLSTGTVSVISGFSKMREFTIENIQKGKPVLIGITNGLFEINKAHYCIAYDYDEAADEVYANFGWGEEAGHQHTRVSNAYDDYFFALTIDFKMEHTHTNNYGVYNDGITNYYCWDNCKIITYKQREHDYTDRYERILKKPDYHYAYCACGERKEVKHLWQTYYEPNWVGEYVQCRVCLFIRQLKDNDLVRIPVNKREEEYEES